MSDPQSLPSEGPPARPPAFAALGRGWKIVLFASLAANLVVAGLVAGALIAGPHGPGGRGPRDLAFGPYTAALTEADRRALFEALRAHRGELPSPRQRVEADRRELARLLRAEPFDRAAAGALLDTQRELADQRFRLGQQLLLDRLAALSPADRQAMAARLETEAGHGAP